MTDIKIITGRINETAISRFIENYRPDLPEQILTTKREICDEFEKLGYNRDIVEFDNE